MLLRERGITANYIVGDATLTAAQFGQWTGLVKSLNDSTQSFVVDAQVACQLLADGGIGAIVNGSSDCATLSGNLNSITFSHIWVQANGTIYDPSFKTYTLRTGIDLPSAMSCGTQAAPSCGTTVKNAGMVGATQGVANGIPYVDNYNLGGAKTANDTLKSNLATYIKTQNINGQGVAASVYDVLGGRQLNAQSGPAAPLSYNARTTWSGGVPDQFRTVLRVKAGTACGSFFADETSGRALVYVRALTAGASNFFSVDGTNISTLSYVPAGSCSAIAAPYAQIQVDHPYAAAAGTYADDIVNFKTVDPPSDEVGFYRQMRAAYLYWDGGISATPAQYVPSQGLYPTHYPEQNYLTYAPITIVQKFGQAGPSAHKSMSDRIALKNPNGLSCGITTTATRLVSRECQFDEHAVVGEAFGTIRTYADTLVDGVGKSVSSRHHDIGIVYAGRMQGLAIMSLQESVSVTAQSGTAQDRNAAFDMHALMLAEAESRANAVDGSQGISAATAFFGYQPVQSTTKASRVYDVSAANMSTYLLMTPHQDKVANTDGSFTYGHFCIKYLDLNNNSLGPDGCWRHLALQDVANQGYSTLMMQGAQSELFYKAGSGSVSSERAFTLWEYVKGGTTVGDALSTAMKSVEVVDASTLRRKFLSVSPSSGEMSYVAGPDIVTGTGDFPYSLPFVRTFSPTYSEKSRNSSTYYYTTSGGLASTASGSSVTGGPDSQYHDRLGGGWTHNYQVMKLHSTDLEYALGSISAYLGSEFIANLEITRELGTSSDLQTKLGAMFALYNIQREIGPYTYNTVMVRTGAQPVVFHRMFDGTLFSPQSPTAQISSQGSYISASGEVITFSPYRYDQATITHDTQTLVGSPSSYSNYVKIFKADNWTFPNGFQLNFQYAPYVLSTGDNCYLDQYNTVIHQPYTGQFGYLLYSVTNSVGHKLVFNFEKKWTRQASTSSCAMTSFYTYALKSVADETGRTATFDNGGQINGNYFTATDPLNHVTRYEYNKGSGGGEVDLTVRNDYQLRRWFTAKDASVPYQKLQYDGMSRVVRLIDRNSHTKSYYYSGLYGAEEWKRSESLDGVGNVTIDIFDNKNGNIFSRSPSGRVTTKTFDNMSRLVRTTLPEGNGSLKSYDLRGNLIQERKFSKTCAVGAQTCADDINTFTSYVEGPTVVNCLNNIVCDKPATETDALGNIKNYTWNTTTGELTNIKLPAGRTGPRPETDYLYTAHNGIRFLTSKIEKIGASQSLTTTYSYDPSNHYVLKDVTVDPTGLNLTTSLTYDTLGNLISVDGPRTDVTDITTYQWDGGRRITAVISPDPDGAGPLLRKTNKYTYDADSLVSRTDTGTATASDGTGFVITTSEVPTYDAMGNKIQSKVTKP
ncbi:hypothetical protein MMA231_04016 (plasmid) [Asticcacaulis sp. MM231]